MSRFACFVLRGKKNLSEKHISVTTTSKFETLKLYFLGDCHNG